ncbi:MAG TPA: SMP-30/gluconolactonase/LRE family protein [Bryobacteraceae bacterium]|nr:SMP-30/gluconolactonase/LRE family protein [Bryobacteraceae bacterium]
MTPRLLVTATGFLIVAAMAQDTLNFPTLGRILRETPAVDNLLPKEARMEVLASGFEWSEGPVWWAKEKALLFSDIPRNSVMIWREAKGVSLWMKPAGFTGPNPYGKEPGSNGLTLDPQGRVVFAEHGDRRISVLTEGGGKRTVVDNYEGKRLNSPNDLVYHSNGDLYFTDPPYGLPKGWDDPLRELDFCGVYRLSKDGKLTLLTKEMSRPNGIAFSPDEKTLYVANSDSARAIWMAFPVSADGTLGKGRVLRDVTEMMGKHKGAPDGLKVDRDGNLWATGPGGVHIMSPEGKLLGRLETGEATANCAWGDDGSTLYITADMWLCRVRTSTRGAGWK